MAETVLFKGETPDAGLVNSYIPYVPPMVKMISGSNIRPPLLTSIADGASEASEFKVDKMPFSFMPYLVFKEIGGEWTVETPLALCHYLQPDGDSRYNIEVCSQAAIANAIREQHNKFIIDTLRIFMKRNDCGTSAGLMTLPPMPENAVDARLGAIKKLTSDKLDTAKRAIQYCARYGVYCGKDYEFDNAFEKANDVCYNETIKERTGPIIDSATGETTGQKRVRVRLEGRPPSWWDGISTTDQSGKSVMWKRGEGHTFLTPNVIAVEGPCLDLIQEAISRLDTDDTTSNAETTNPFDTLFPMVKTLTAPPSTPVDVESVTELVSSEDV